MAWLIVVGDRDALRWILENRRMAFRDHVRGHPEPGEHCALYVTRGAFRNPTRDESQVIALGRFESEIEDRPAVVNEESFGRSVGLAISAELPPREGLPFRPLVESLSFIRKKETWFAYVRTTLVHVPAEDYLRIEDAFKRFASSAPRSQ